MPSLVVHCQERRHVQINAPDYLRQFDQGLTDDKLLGVYVMLETKMGRRKFCLWQQGKEEM
jgi:hypothetical protein